MLFFFNDTATTEIYTLSLHDALPIFVNVWRPISSARRRAEPEQERAPKKAGETREKIEISDEHTSELQSPDHPECPPLLVKNNCQVEAAQWRGKSRSDKQQEEQGEAI